MKIEQFELSGDKEYLAGIETSLKPGNHVPNARTLNEILRHTAISIDMRELSDLSSQYFLEMRETEIKHTVNNFVIPAEIKESSFNLEYKKLMIEIFELYQEMTKKGIHLQDAKAILPLATETKTKALFSGDKLYDLLGALKNDPRRETQDLTKEIFSEIREQNYNLANILSILLTDEAEQKDDEVIDKLDSLILTKATQMPISEYFELSKTQLPKHSREAFEDVPQNREYKLPSSISDGKFKEGYEGLVEKVKNLRGKINLELGSEIGAYLLLNSEKITVKYSTKHKHIFSKKDRGLFIVFEGIDNSGKTTLAGMIEEYLQRNGRKVVRSREPGGTKEGEAIRKILKDKNNVISPEQEVVMFCTSRKAYTEQKVKPTVERGEVFISDRYKHSTEAYQAAGGIDKEFIREWNDWATKGIEPDLVILVDRNARESIESIAVADRDRFEQDAEYMEKVRENYLGIAKENPRFRVVQYVHGDKEAMFEEAKKHIDSLLE